MCVCVCVCVNVYEHALVGQCVCVCVCVVVLVRYTKLPFPNHSHPFISISDNSVKCYFVHTLLTAEWQVMCVFKALHVNPNDQHSELRDTEFYDFYEVQNLKWREVSGIIYTILCTRLCA